MVTEEQKTRNFEVICNVGNAKWVQEQRFIVDIIDPYSFSKTSTF